MNSFIKYISEKRKRFKFERKIRLTPTQIIAGSFFLAILTGTLLLWLPISSAPGESTDFLTALFTSTTSVCVTGLVVVDTYIHWSLFGKIVILILIQLGGLGIITVTYMLLLMLRRKFTLGDRNLLQDAFNLDTRVGLLSFLVSVFKGTFAIEAIGAALYSIVFIPEFGVAKGIWISVFNSVSAFCNAGIDILGADSLARYNSNPLVMTVTMVLIILGGLGYVVWFDIYTSVRSGIKSRYTPVKIVRRFREHTRLVLYITMTLIVLGAAMIFIFEYGNPGTIGNMTTGDKLLNSLFQSVTFRTAGFSTIPQQNLRDVSCIAGYLLMFIGGSPIGTAGGVKTVTVFIVVMNAYSFICGRNETVILKRKISEALIRKAAAIVAVSVMAVFTMTVFLLATNDVTVTDGAYEVISALATVGLTRGLTPVLNNAGRVIIIISMYLGRIGPISMALFFAKTKIQKNGVSFAEGRFYVG